MPVNVERYEFIVTCISNGKKVSRRTKRYTKTQEDALNLIKKGLKSELISIEPFEPIMAKKIKEDFSSKEDIAFKEYDLSEKEVLIEVEDLDDEEILSEEEVLAEEEDLVENDKCKICKMPLSKDSNSWCSYHYSIIIE